MEIKFGDQFPDTYFGESSTMKKEYIAKADFSVAILAARNKIAELIVSANLNLPAADWCRDCFSACFDEFFFMPTASTGKYHGGPTDACNCVGGNIVHTEQVLAMADKVLKRYETALGVFYPQLSEALRVACILHDLCKYSSGSIWTDKYHGEAGSKLIKSVDTDYDFSGLVAESVANHMYAWKFQTVWDFIINTSGSANGLLLSAMLSECDYYSIRT